MRSQASGIVGGWVWGSKFIAAAAATLVIALGGAWMLAGRDSADIAAGERLAQEAVRTAAPRQHQGEVRFTQTGYPAGIQYVSDDYLGNVPLDENSRQLPFSMASDPRMDYLLRENELLRRKVERLRMQNVYLQKLLGYSAFDAGLVLGPAGAITLLVLPMVGKATERFDSRLLLAVGLLVNAYAVYYMSGFNLQIDFQTAAFGRTSAHACSTFASSSPSTEAIAPGRASHASCM